MKNALVAVALLLSSTAFARPFGFYRARPAVVVEAPLPVRYFAPRPFYGPRFYGPRFLGVRRFHRRFYR
jgi:hypothetical protein